MKNKETMESRFGHEFSHVGWIPENKQHILSFIKSEQSKLLQAILEKKDHVAIDNAGTEIEEAVLVEDIHSVAKEWGIEI